MTALCALFGTCLAALAPISGRATVQDGDTIYVNEQPIRLQGVDAEELDEPHGFGAKATLQAAIGHEIVTCKPDGTRSYKRVVATCYVGNLDVGLAVIAAGWALDCAHYSGGRYRAFELPGARQNLIQKPYC